VVIVDKIIVKCKSCKKDMKILNKKGKYRCPYCKEVYRLNTFNKFTLKIRRISKDFIKTLVDIKNTLKYRMNVAKYHFKNRKR
jgi:predicted RNA-binding Zn-ribbon protein involved in translation (DUF1610 family)